MAGRYEDALKVMERQTPDNYSKYAWVERAASLAVLGRKAEAEATVQEALRRYPDLTIEAVVNDQGFSAAEHQRHIETRKTRALLAYLALPLGRPHARETIASLLWSDRGEKQAHASLRQALLELGRTFDAVGINPLVKRRTSLASRCWGLPP
jgi:tetratricopeptide (TPR) repeat protein